MSELHEPGAAAGLGAADAQTLPYIGREDCHRVRYPASAHLPFAGRGVGGIRSGAKAEILLEPSENVGYPIWEVAARGRQAARDDELRRETLATIGQFACGTAHDVGNLLVGIVFALSRLRGRQQAGELEETVGHALQAAEQGLAATRRLLQLARHRPPRREIFDLNGCIQEIYGLLREAAGLDAHLSLALAPDIWTVDADANATVLALLNLATNARDAMPKGGDLRVGTANVVLHGEIGGLTGEFVALTMADTGTGMPEAVRSRACEPFFTTKMPGKGSGLGLTQVCEFARAARGRVSIRSRVGQGTTITLYLPRARSDR